jgi:DNA-3-methyladenine glycosylase II
VGSFCIEPQGPFTLATSVDFLRGFTPASDMASAGIQQLALGFRLDRSFEPVGIELSQARADAPVNGTVSGTRDTRTARAQVARLLSIDQDARGFAALLRREPVLAELVTSYPGFRPVCFASPYEAAVWAVLAARINMRSAAAIKLRLASERGDPVHIGGKTIHTIPAPHTFLRMRSFPGISAEKLRRLQAVADAALTGRLDAERLRSMDPNAALAQLCAIPGVGNWTAAHILLRGAATTDLLAEAEPRIAAAVALAYGLSSTPSPARCAEIAERWRPYRSWVSVLLVLHLFRSGKAAVRGRRGAGGAKRSRAARRR